MDKEMLGKSVKLYLRFLVVNVMCFFVAVSLFVLATAVFTQTVGYKVYGTQENSEETKELYTHYESDGEDLKAAEYEKEGYTLRKATIRSDMSAAKKTICLIVTQLFCLGILLAFVYPSLWDFGAKDSNAVKFGRRTEDVWKGVKIGLTAMIPAYLVLILICVMKSGWYPGFPVALYQTSHSAFYGFLGGVIGKAKTLADLAWWRVALLFIFPLLVPATGGIAYYLGYKDFSLGEKLIYKKNRE